LQIVSYVLFSAVAPPARPPRASVPSAYGETMRNMSKAFDRTDPSAKSPDDPDWEWTEIELNETTDGVTPPTRVQGEWTPRTADLSRRHQLLAEAEGLGD
jgi:hypothetical protein